MRTTQSKMTETTGCQIPVARCARTIVMALNLHDTASSADGRKPRPVRNDTELKQLAFNAFANWLETGDVLLSANDAIARKQHRIIKRQDPEKTREILRLRELAEGGG